VEREEKAGGAGAPKKRGRWRKYRLGILLAILAFLIVAAIYPCKYVMGYLDVSGGRGRVMTKYFGLTVGEEVHDTYLSFMYKRYISEQLPSPDWRFSSFSAYNLTGNAVGFGDSFLLEDFNALRWNTGANYYIQNNDFAADDDAWRAILTTFMDILQKYSGNRDRGVAENYVSQLVRIRDEKDRPLRAEDIPNADEMHRLWEEGAS
jgi:hypothetical protein